MVDNKDELDKNRELLKVEDKKGTMSETERERKNQWRSYVKKRRKLEEMFQKQKKDEIKLNLHKMLGLTVVYIYLK